jgi:PEP-CTERM motif
MRKLMAGAALAATMALAGQASAATNFLVNGSFETGDFTGWTQGGNLAYTTVELSGFFYTAASGNYYALEGPFYSDGFLSQTFSDAPGSTLLISGWVIGNGTSPSDVGFYFDGTPIVYIDPIPDQPWTEYSFTVTATGTDTFLVGFRNDPSGDGLDNFSVTAIPEASTWAMMLLGFASLGYAGYHRARLAA